MRLDSSPQKKKFGDGKTARGHVIDPAVAGLERGGIAKEAALTMLRRGQRGLLEAIGKGATRALLEILSDSSLEKYERKSAADILIGTDMGGMRPEDVAFCFLVIGFPREREIAKMQSPRVDLLLKNILLDGSEEQEIRARAAFSLKERGFRGFGNAEYDAVYFFFSGNCRLVPSCGLAAVPFLLERLKEDLSTENRKTAAALLGEISDLCDEPYDWREVARSLRMIAEGDGERSNQNDLMQACVDAFKRITGVYPSQDRNRSTICPAED